MIRSLAFLLATAFVALGADHWVVTWGTSPSPPMQGEREMAAAGLEFSNHTVREIVHTSIGGSVIRVRLSNAHGKGTAVIGAAHIALRAGGSSIVPGSDRELTFGGRSRVAIPADAQVVSDPVKLEVPAAADLAVSLWLPERINGSGIHYAAQQTSYIAGSNATAAESLPDSRTFTSWVFLAGVDVLAPEKVYAVAAFGDSITDGARSDTDANHRWPDILAARLRPRGIAVLNAGIGGNRILHDGAGPNARFGVNALARFDRDVLDAPGVRYVIVLEGINDLGHAGQSAPESEAVSAGDLEFGLRQLIERAHARGVKVIGATVTPFEGTIFPGYYSTEKDARRKVLNEWIRGGGVFDGVVDFERVVRDPEHPTRLLPAFDCGDHLHPQDAGYKAMGEAVDLTLFR